MLCSQLRAQHLEQYQAHSGYSGNVLKDYLHPSLQVHMHTLTPCPVYTASPGAGLHPLLVSSPAQSPDTPPTSGQEELVSWTPVGRVAAPLPFPEPRLAGKGLGVS